MTDNAKVHDHSQRTKVYDEALETLRQYWNSCEENGHALQYGRIYSIFSEFASKMNGLSGPADDVYQWILDHPYDAQLALFEATNNDTFGGKQPSPTDRRKYLAARFPDLQRQSATEDDGK